MLNNATDHSLSEIIEVGIRKEKGSVHFYVYDKGIGIFTSIARKKDLANHMEAIQELIKGKLTTAPERHTGEGIFFTSKVATMFIIRSAEKKIIFDNILDDIFIRDIRNIRGTRVNFSLDVRSQTGLGDVFREYTDESFEFSKTEVTVKLFKTGPEYISRSQAKRILSGLDKFKTVTLDFHNVRTVGQGFADEVFRVWRSRHPNIVILTKNANENVEFMVKRAQGQSLF
ncbi:STAS-like domain-containing protein [Candidatus Omnitrophota bacterium]